MNFNRNNVGGAIIDVYISMVALLPFGIVINIVNIFRVLLSTNRQSNASLGKGAFGFVIPLFTALNGVVFGSIILSATEGWGVVDGANLQSL